MMTTVENGTTALNTATGNTTHDEMNGDGSGDAALGATAKAATREAPGDAGDRSTLTLLKGPDALAARRDVASKLDHRAIAALRKPMHVDKPDWSLMQQLSDAGIGVCPTSGMPVLDPSACAPGLRTAIWRAYCGVASSVNTKQMGQTDEALDELQMRLHEHAAQITEQKQRGLVAFEGWRERPPI